MGGALPYRGSSLNQHNRPIKISECTASLCSGEKRQGRLSLCKSCSEQTLLWKAAFLFRKTGSKGCLETRSLQYAELLSLRIFRRLGRVRDCSREAVLLPVLYISSAAETMAQDRHILIKVILERFLWPTSLSPLLTNKQNETIKTGNASATTRSGQIFSGGKMCSLL